MVRAVCVGFVAVCMMLPTPVQAQANTGTVSVNVNRGVTISKQTDLDFGNFASGTSQSTWQIDEDTGVLSRRNGNAVSLGGTQSRAAFEITGLPLLRVRLTIGNAFINLTRDGGGATMRVNQFRLDGPNNRFLDLNGKTTYRVGGQLRIGANQQRGKYSGTFDVTADYQ